MVVNAPGPPAMLPPDQFRLLVVMPSLPVSVPPLTVSALVKLTVDAVVSKLSVPPFRLVVPLPAML